MPRCLQSGSGPTSCRGPGRGLAVPPAGGLGPRCSCADASAAVAAELGLSQLVPTVRASASASSSSTRITDALSPHHRSVPLRRAPAGGHGARPSSSQTPAPQRRLAGPGPSCLPPRRAAGRWQLGPRAQPPPSPGARPPSPPEPLSALATPAPRPASSSVPGLSGEATGGASQARQPRVVQTVPALARSSPLLGLQCPRCRECPPRVGLPALRRPQRRPPAQPRLRPLRRPGSARAPRASSPSPASLVAAARPAGSERPTAAPGPRAVAGVSSLDVCLTSHHPALASSSLSALQDTPDRQARARCVGRLERAAAWLGLVRRPGARRLSAGPPQGARALPGPAQPLRERPREPHPGQQPPGLAQARPQLHSLTLSHSLTHSLSHTHTHTHTNNVSLTNNATPKLF